MMGMFPVNSVLFHAVQGGRDTSLMKGLVLSNANLRLVRLK